MNASVTGVSDSRAVQAQAIIRRVLEPWTGSSEVTIVAHRLSTGAWTLMAFDGADLVMLKDGLAARVVEELARLTESPG